MDKYKYDAFIEKQNALDIDKKVLDDYFKPLIEMYLSSESSLSDENEFTLSDRPIHYSDDCVSYEIFNWNTSNDSDVLELESLLDPKWQRELATKCEAKRLERIKYKEEIAAGYKAAEIKQLEERLRKLKENE